ncbi:hypothetical protein KIPB_006626, partial [Kipferlia bialata]|eukprot:g3488.t1
MLVSSPLHALSYHMSDGEASGGWGGGIDDDGPGHHSFTPTSQDKPCMETHPGFTKWLL